MKKFYIPALLSILISGCNNLEDASVTNRNSFVRFYEGANSYTAATAELTPDGGYLIGGTIRIEGDSRSQKMLLVKTDAFGKKQWEKIVDGGSVGSILIKDNEYIIVGDSVKFSPSSSVLSELENYSSRIIRLSLAGDVTQDKSLSVKSSGLHVDMHATGITVDDDNNFIVLGTFHRAGGTEFASVTALNPSTLDTVWSQRFNYLDRNYINTRSVFYDNGKILWGASVSQSANNFTRSYLTVPVVQERSTFINSNYYGQNMDQVSLTIRDIQGSKFFGYGAIGTYSESDGSKSNLFFIRIDTRGNFIEESIRYFDGRLSSMNAVLQNPSLSEVQDTGEAIASTNDGGYILAGSTINPDNGSLDIWLIRLDVSGTPLWTKTIGGKSNEIVSSIRVTPDGGYLICGTIQDGTNQAGGLSSMFLIKTDSNGELIK